MAIPRRAPATLALLLALIPSRARGQEGDVLGVHDPCIAKERTWYYLFVSFDQCCRGVESTYRTFAGRSLQVTGPYLDRGQRSMRDGEATLVLKGYGNFRGPGGASVLLEGERSWIVHHEYDVLANGAPRLQVRPLVFAADGWPLAGEPLSAPPAEVVPAPVAGNWGHSVDFGAESQITLLSSGKINQAGSQDTWSLQGSTLTLKWPRPDAPGGAWVDSCVLSGDGRSYVGRNQLDTIIRGSKLRSAFVRGDSNGDGAVDLSDAILSLLVLYGGRKTACLDSLDANDDGRVNIADPAFTLLFLFRSGPPLPPPFPGADFDSTSDSLGC